MVKRQPPPTTRRRLLGLAAAIACTLPIVPAVAENQEALVFAAASLKNALDDANAEYARETGDAARISYAASPTLAKQIENGAPADIFISADLDWMDYLAQRNLLMSGTRKNFLANELAMIAPQDSPARVRIEPGFPLADLLAGGRLAMADTGAVPAGKYGKAALESLGVWSSVANRIAQAENVRAALALVARKEAPLGIVYRTDAVAEPNVKVVAVFPADTHPPIVYPIALLAGSTNPGARGFLAYLESAQARPFFEKQGFKVIE
jgi:molybdate transport system substrate-binding protein